MEERRIGFMSKVMQAGKRLQGACRKISRSGAPGLSLSPTLIRRFLDEGPHPQRTGTKESGFRLGPVRKSTGIVQIIRLEQAQLSLPVRQENTEHFGNTGIVQHGMLGPLRGRRIFTRLYFADRHAAHIALP